MTTCDEQFVPATGRWLVIHATGRHEGAEPPGARVQRAPLAVQRFDLVVAGNAAKFRQNPDLQDFLLGTGNRVLAEPSPRDRIWGMGLAANEERATPPNTALG